MNVLIIGNGFDLAHKLETRYTDFLRYCRDYDCENPISDDEAIASEFFESISYNTWLKYFIHITPNLDDKDKTWIDFEREMAKVVSTLERECDAIQKSSTGKYTFALYAKEDNGVILDVKKFLDFLSKEDVFILPLARPASGVEVIQIKSKADLIEYLYRQLRLFIRAFEIYCCFYVDVKGCDKPIRVGAKDVLAQLDALTRKLSRTNFTRINRSNYQSSFQEIRDDITAIKEQVIKLQSYWEVDVNSLSKEFERLNTLIDNVASTFAALSNRPIDVSAFERSTSEIFSCVQSFQRSINPPSFLEFNKFDCVLSFNYTATFQRLYGTDTTKYCYIHGQAQADPTKTNLILGIDDALTDEQARRNFEWSKFKKYFQRVFFRTGSEYKDWLEEAKQRKTPMFIHVVGHSLDRTDHDVLKEFFSTKKRIFIYYHNETDYIEKMQRVIEIIGRSELIKRVHGCEWTIRFVDQYGPDGIFERRQEGSDKAD